MKKVLKINENSRFECMTTIKGDSVRDLFEESLETQLGDRDLEVLEGHFNKAIHGTLDGVLGERIGWVIRNQLHWRLHSRSGRRLEEGLRSETR